MFSYRRVERWYLLRIKLVCSMAVPSACSSTTLRNFCDMYILLHPLHQQPVENKGLSISCPLPFFILHQVEKAPFFPSELPEAMLELLVEISEESLNCQPVILDRIRGCN